MEKKASPKTLASPPVISLSNIRFRAADSVATPVVGGGGISLNNIKFRAFQ